jgi:sec-independent protein translocase protein TatA
MSSVLPLFAIFDVGGPEVLVIMFIILLLFGGQKMPELAKGLGKSIREFKKAASNVEDELKRAIEEHPEPAKPLPKLADPVPAPVPALPPGETPTASATGTEGEIKPPA